MSQSLTAVYCHLIYTTKNRVPLLTADLQPRLYEYCGGILRAKGVRQLFLAGIATNWVVESTTRYGAELGYDVTVLADCCQGFSDELHDFAIKNTLPYYASIAKSTDFIAALGGVAAARS